LITALLSLAVLACAQVVFGDAPAIGMSAQSYLPAWWQAARALVYFQHVGGRQSRFALSYTVIPRALCLGRRRPL